VPSAKEVQMEVKDGLAGVGIGIDHRAITSLRDSLPLRKLRRQGREPAHDGRIGELVERRDVLAWNDKDVNRCLGIDVAKGDAVVGLGDDLGRDLLAYDPAEQTGIRHCFS